MYFASYKPDTGSVFQRSRIPDTFEYETDEIGTVVNTIVTTVLPEPAGDWLNFEVTEEQFNDKTPSKVVDGALVPDVEGIKFSKNLDINRWRREADAYGFMYLDKRIAADSASQNDIYGVDAIVQRTGAFPSWWVGGWKADDNSFVIINTILAWNDFVTAMTTQGGTNFIHAQQLKGQLAAATTTEDVEAIVW
jgi:hypothetical protein